MSWIVMHAIYSGTVLACFHEQSQCFWVLESHAPMPAEFASTHTLREKAGGHLAMLMPDRYMHVCEMSPWSWYNCQIREYLTSPFDIIAQAHKMLHCGWSATTCDTEILVSAENVSSVCSCKTCKGCCWCVLSGWVGYYWLMSKEPTMKPVDVSS